MLQAATLLLLALAMPLNAETDENHFRIDYIRDQCRARGEDPAACVERELAAGREIGKWLRANDDATKRATLLRCGSADQRPDGLQGVMGCIRGEAKTLAELSTKPAAATTNIPKVATQRARPQEKASGKTSWNADAAQSTQSKTKAELAPWQKKASGTKSRWSGTLAPASGGSPSSEAGVCHVTSVSGLPLAYLTRPGKDAEFYNLMRAKRSRDAEQCCAACMVTIGTEVVVTDRGLSSSTVRVVSGDQRGCSGDLRNDFFDCSTGAGDRMRSECQARGIAYFKDIGSFPTLSNGRDATTEARERCGRSAKAF